MQEMLKAAEQYRGLRAKQSVPCGSIDRELLKKKMLEAMQDELPAEKMAALEAGLKAFGLIPQEMALGKYFPDLLTSQVGGFYDPKRKYLVIVKGADGLLGKEARKQYGEDLADRMEQTVIVHELTHAIQDQTFDLEKFAKSEPLSDEGAARTALLEGDATLTMYDFFSGMRLEDMPMAEQMMNQLFKDPKQLLAMSPDMPGSKEMADAPAWFRDNLLFSYMQGFTFVMNVRKVGGQKLLDYAYTTDPPRSTEQILHPEKWHTKRDDPVAIEFPDLAKELPGYKKVSEGQLGEQTIKILLREKLKDDDKAATAAAGWGGDRFAVYQKDKNTVLAWITEWDSTQDSQEFKDAAAALGDGWKIETPRPSRVVVIRGKLEAAELAALSAKLGDAKAQAPANKNIDLAALGAKKKAGGEGTDLAKALEGLLGGKDGDNKAAGKDGEKAGGLDLGAILNDPQAQEMIKKMFSQEQPAGKVADDGRSYTNEKLGYTIKLPASAKDWKLDPKPQPPMSVLITSPTQTVQVTVASQALPLPIAGADLGPMLEMGAGMIAEKYQKISGAVVETNGQKGYELHYSGTIGGQQMRSAQRAYSVNGTMIMLQALAPAAEWPNAEKAIKETFDSFSFIETKAETKKE
jgi:hypothetical protein